MQKQLSLIVLLLSSILMFSCAAGKKNKSAYIQQTFETLKKELPDATVTLLDDTIKVLFPENVMFASNSADINETFMPKMKKFSTILNRFRKTSILINGYTDNTGSQEINAKLSNERAMNARNAMIGYKVKPGRLYAWGHGPNNPIASNNTVEGKQKNRRVEFLVLYDVD